MEEKKKREEKKFEFDDILPKDDEEAIERYIDEIPNIFVDKYMNYFNVHKEDDELARCYPDDFERSVRVLPLERDGERYLQIIATNENKTRNFHRFLKEGKFTLEPEFIDGVDRERVRGIILRRMNMK